MQSIQFPSAGFRVSSAWPHALLGVAVICGSALVSAQSAPPAVSAPTVALKVDQAGYLQDAPKVALVGAPASAFELREAATGKRVFQGHLSAAQTDADTGDTVQAADFTAFRQPGEYYLFVPGLGRSWKFSIAPNVYQHAYYLAMRAFYGQRCGTAVDLGPEFAGYAHPACHLKGEFHISSGLSGERDNIGGWHDAGDYGRYVVNSGVTVGMLLWSHELYGAKIDAVALKIPESGNGTPDVLNEVRWNLNWMRKMQDADGGVWHKQTSTHFDGFEAPEADLLPSEVIGTGAAPFKGTCASADLAATSAIAARVYKPFDARFAVESLDSARRAWAWAEKNPDATFRNPAGVSTGEYGDANCHDEMLWAAAELWRTTGEKSYNDFFVAHYAEYLSTLDAPPAENWATQAPMALWSYALETRKGTDARVVKAIRERAVAAARAIVTRTESSAYRQSMRTQDYVWGSNSLAAQYGDYLLIADRFQHDAAFVNAALDNLHYLLGRNAFSLSFVTRVGENPFQHPHHRPSDNVQHKGAWPGLLSGGPNANRQDAELAKLPKDTPPAKSYADVTASYASNEIAINWQASLVFLLAGVLR